MIKCEIKRKTNKKIVAEIENNLPTAMTKLMEYAKKEALKHKKGDKDDSLILFEITINNGVVTGRLYTNFDYALFLEYGTGTKAEMPHIGHTKTFKESGFTYWFLPKEIADARDMSLPESRLVYVNGSFFYMMYATKSYPYMRPTAFELENSAKKIFAEALINELRK